MEHLEATASLSGISVPPSTTRAKPDAVRASRIAGGESMAHPTRLETFIRSRCIKPAHLAREAGYSRQHLFRLRKGQMDPTRRCIAAIIAAARRLSGEKVSASDLFELERD